MMATPGFGSQTAQGVFKIRSQTDLEKFYEVKETGNGLVCSCPWLGGALVPDGSTARRASHPSMGSSGRRSDMTDRYEQARSGGLVRNTAVNPAWYNY